MKLLRLKITDPAGFRSLQPNFEHLFRSEWTLQEELNQTQSGFAPFVCAGPNGSGKSNLLEVLAAIFYHLECLYLDNLPDSFQYDEQDNPLGFRSERATPDGFEIEYLIRPKEALKIKGLNGLAHIKIVKPCGQAPQWFLLNHEDQPGEVDLTIGRTLGRQLLPDFVLGYSSGENEILSLPFFKMRFIQFDEYWNCLTQQLPYPGRPETRMAYIDSSFSQAILLCNLLYHDADTLKPFQQDMGLGELQEFRIIVKRTIDIAEEQVLAFESKDSNSRESIEDILKRNSALIQVIDDQDRAHYKVNLLALLESEKSDLTLTKLKRCATIYYLDEETDTLYLDYCVNQATKEAVAENFSSAIELFQAFQILLTLNLYSVSEKLKADLYQSNSHYVSETVPVLASDERIMRFKFVKFSKEAITEPVMLKDLSDGEHQLLHSLGLCLLFKDTNSLFLLDEPETHFNPSWRANFISRLRACFKESSFEHADKEMLITTHTPFLISDSERHKVLMFNKIGGEITVAHPEYNTLGHPLIG